MKIIFARMVIAAVAFIFWVLLAVSGSFEGWTSGLFIVVLIFALAFVNEKK